MRTIDSDDFLKQSTELYKDAGWDEREVHFSLADLRCNLKMMPIVEAIPVDWLLQQGKTAYASDTVEYIREAEHYNKTITDLIDKWRSEREEE